MPGSIRKRGAAWTVTVDLGRDPGTGKRRQLFRSARTKREAEAMLVQLLHERDSGLERPVGRLTVAEYLESGGLRTTLASASPPARPLTTARSSGSG